MFIYNGKFKWLQYADNENITVIVPASFALNDPICAYWQWTVDANGNEKANVTKSGTINTVTNTDIYQVSFTLDSYYSFDAIVASDFSTLTATMRNPQGDRSDPITLTRQYGDAARVPSTAVCTGKLNWLEYAKNEMITLVIPAGVSNDAPVGLYHQWTVDASGNEKKNHPVNATFRNVTTSSNGDVKGTFDDGYYTFEATVLNGGQEATIRMSNPNGDTTSSSTKQTDFRGLGTKKALIIRFGTGTDNGICLVQDMLTKHLGFAPGDVEMSYFDIDPESGPKQCTKGQDPPTATRFKSKFTSLLSSASAGDVRFLYVDAHGTTYPDEDGSGEPDDEDEGWILAENDDGTRKEVVNDDWVGKAIRGNLKSGINLTILTSSCMGGGMLDTHTATPGILLAGCHETQFNVKALRTNDGMLDPWMYAVTAIIKKQVQRKRGVPSYTVLFNEGKKFIKKQLDGGQLSAKYKGASPDETKPIPRDQDSNTSNQDPQLIFYSGYVDQDVEKFLFPFTAANGGKASGDPTRYPHDEL